MYCTTLNPRSYTLCPDVRFPEVPACVEVTTALVAFRTLLVQSGFGLFKSRIRGWNPLGAIIREGAKVVIKPKACLVAKVWLDGGSDAGREKVYMAPVLLLCTGSSVNRLLRA